MPEEETGDQEPPLLPYNAKNLAGVRQKKTILIPAYIWGVKQL